MGGIEIIIPHAYDPIGIITDDNSCVPRAYFCQDALKKLSVSSSTIGE